MKHLSRLLSPLLISSLIVWPLPAQPPAPLPADRALHLLLKSSPAAAVNSQAALGFLVEVSDAKGLPVPDAAVAFRLPDEGATGTFADGSRAAVVYTDRAGQARSPAIRWGSLAGSANVRITAAKEALHAGLLAEEMIQTAGNPRTPGTLPISGPQVVIVSSTDPALPEPPAIHPPAAAEAPALLPAPPDAGISKRTEATKSGAGPAPALKPAVSIVNKSEARPHSNKKWLILALVGVGAGVGAALALKGKSSTVAAASTATPPIGTPTVTVGSH